MKFTYTLNFHELARRAYQDGARAQERPFGDDEEARRWNKELFVFGLEDLLKSTRCGIGKLELMPDGDTVAVYWASGDVMQINIACDSYAAIIEDVLKRII